MLAVYVALFTDPPGLYLKSSIKSDIFSNLKLSNTLIKFSSKELKNWLYIR